MMRLTLLILALFAVKLNARAETPSLKVVSCWNGFSNDDQKRNLRSCKQQARDEQKCSTNIWEHKHAAFDVCLMEAPGPMVIVSKFAGFSQADQDKNFRICKSQEDQNQICVKNIWVHKQAAYDVCLMQPAEIVVQRPVQPKPVAQKPVSTVKPLSRPHYLASGDYCHPITASGKTFGDPVADSFCTVGYRAHGDYCHPIDAAGNSFGNPVSDSLCKVSYRSIGDYCHPVDANGNTYGDPVADSNCKVSYRAVGDYCHPVDVRGNAFGDPVADSLCRVGYALAGDYCHPTDVTGKTYGNPVADSFCQ